MFDVSKSQIKKSQRDAGVVPYFSRIFIPGFKNYERQGH